MSGRWAILLNDAKKKADGAPPSALQPCLCQCWHARGWMAVVRLHVLAFVSAASCVLHLLAICSSAQLEIFVRGNMKFDRDWCVEMQPSTWKVCNTYISDYICTIHTNALQLVVPWIINLHR